MTLPGDDIASPRHGSPAGGPPVPVSAWGGPGLGLPATPRLQVCRLHHTGVLLDVPIRPPPHSYLRAATFWPDSWSPDGWSRRQWERGPDGRGVVVPQMTELGDLIAFGAFRPQPSPTGTSLFSFSRGRDTQPGNEIQIGVWWGYLHAIEAGALVLHGPHPDLTAAHHAAQQALLRNVHHQAADTPGASPGGRPGAAWEPGQRPVAPSLTWHGDTATVGDPVHGWLQVPADDLAAALTLPTDDLTHRIGDRYRALDPATPRITLAALAALNAPDQLPNLHAPPPRHPEPEAEPAAPDPAPPTPASPTEAPDMAPPDAAL
jgi:hypothetical protein